MILIKNREIPLIAFVCTLCDFELNFLPQRSQRISQRRSKERNTISLLRSHNMAEIHFHQAS